MENGPESLKGEYENDIEKKVEKKVEMNNDQVNEDQDNKLQTNEEDHNIHVKSEPNDSKEPEPTIKREKSSKTPESDAKRYKPSEEPEVDDFTSTEPVHEIVGGSTIRKYLNQHLSHHLLDGLRQLGYEKPEDPVRWLGEFLIERSKQP